MMLTVSAVGWRPSGSDRSFERSEALNAYSHLELIRIPAMPGTRTYQVWATLYIDAPEDLQRLAAFKRGGQRLEWTFDFEGDHRSLTIALPWLQLDRSAREVTLMREKIERDLEEEIGVDLGATNV
jgi:hypothetical protein